MENQIVKRKISDLKPHPQNEKIYGINEDVSDIKDSILKDGISDPLKITNDNTIISGHRRWKVCCELVSEGHSAFDEVDCIIEHYDSIEDEINDLINANMHRHKNYEQIAREAQEKSKIYGVLAQKRMKSGKAADPMENLPQGSTRHIISEELKRAGIDIKEKSVDYLIKAIEKMDLYESSGKQLESQILRNELHKTKPTFSTIDKLNKHLDELSDSEKKQIADKSATISDVLKKTSKANASDRKNSEKAEAIVKEDYSISIHFQQELHLLDVQADVMKSRIDELKRIINQHSVTSYYPTELIKAMKNMDDSLKKSLRYVSRINKSYDCALIQKLSVINEFDFWQRLNWVKKPDNDIYKYNDEIIFTILRALALVTENSNYWLYSDEDDYYSSYGYNNNYEMLLFAEKFNVEENGYIVENTVNLFKQFDDILSRFENLSSAELRFLNSCNIPHMINGLNYFIECDCENIDYYDIIKAFLQPENIRDYNNEITEASNDLADWTYTIDNVEARNDFIKSFIDDYIDEFGDVEDTEEDEEEQ